MNEIPNSLRRSNEPDQTAADTNAGTTAEIDTTEVEAVTTTAVGIDAADTTTGDVLPRKWRNFVPIHKAAALFEPISPAELQALADDIAKNGLREPVAVYEDADPNDPDWQPDFLLDGQNRTRCA